MRMSVKDRVVSWYVNNIILPKIEITDNPGFILENMSSIKPSVVLREIFLPESLVACLEDRVGRSLYAVGKKFGYIYSGLSDFPRIDELSRKEFVNFVYFLIRYTEGTYASRITHELDYEHKSMKIAMTNYIVCRRNGMGSLFSEGGIAGIWAYMMRDKTVEAVQETCQGRGDKRCEVITAPYRVLRDMGKRPQVCTQLEKATLDRTYLDINKARPARWASHSLKSMMESGFFKYAHGQVTFKGERFFLTEASFMYVLEEELRKEKNGLSALWDVSFDCGKHIAAVSGQNDPSMFIPDFLPALGFGDIMVTSHPWKVMVNCFPWGKWSDAADFVMFRGLLSGLITGMTGRGVRLQRIQKDVSGEGFSLIVQE